MTTRQDQDLDVVLRQFLGDGPVEAPDPAIAAALERIATMRQRPDTFLRRSRMSTPVRLLIAAAVAIGILAGGALMVGNRPPTEPAPASPAASVVPIASASPQPSPTLAPTPSPTPTPTPTPTAGPSDGAAASPALLLVKTYWCKTLADAEPLILADGFTLGKTTRSDSIPGDIPATWRILQQAPGPGKMAEPGQPIDLIFANHSNTETDCS
jgi:hypothetical protein